MIDKVQYWMQLADDDLDVAQDLHKTGHWLYVAFMCHQSIEKMIKAYWCAKREDDPPYTHNIHRLAEQCELANDMSTPQLHFLHVMLPLNIEARYPDYKESVARSLNKERSQQILSATQELVQWIKTKC